MKSFHQIWGMDSWCTTSSRMDWVLKPNTLLLCAASPRKISNYWGPCFPNHLRRSEYDSFIEETFISRLCRTPELANLQTWDRRSQRSRNSDKAPTPSARCKSEIHLWSMNSSKTVRLFSAYAQEQIRGWLVAPWSASRDGGPVQARTIPDETMHLGLFGCKWV